MTVRTAVLSTSGLLAGFALAATAMAGAAATRRAPLRPNRPPPR